MTSRTGCLAVVLLLAAALASSAATVKEIRVRSSEEGGLVDEQAVLAYVSTRVGDEFSRPAANRDVKALQKSGRFSRVSVEIEPVPGGVNVAYVVQGRLRIRRLEITGADTLGNRKVRELMELGVGDLADNPTLAVAAQKVTDAYGQEYYPDAKLTWTIEPGPEEGTANVTVKVKEGRRATVRRIRFPGARRVSPRTLRKAMTQRTVNWLSIVTKDGRYSPDALETDVLAVQQVYRDRGYLDVDVGEPSISWISRRKLAVEIPVREGSRYRVESIAVAGVTSFPPSQVQASVRLKPGDIASEAAIRKSQEAVRDFYGSRGRIRTVVDNVVDENLEQSTVSVRYDVTEGRLAYLRNIGIRGNSQTKDHVIRRELSVYPGEIFNEVKVRSSERRVKNLGYFSYVNSVPESTSTPDEYDLTFEVEQDKTGQFMVGAGYSSEDQLVGFIEVAQRDFDLLDWPRFSGGGQKLRLRAQFGTKRNDYEVSFVEPWFLNRRLSLGVDLYDHESRYYSSSYDQSVIGADISLGKGLTAFDRLNLIYSLQEYDISDVSSNAPLVIREEEGNRSKSGLTLELAHDTRDSFFIPSRGNRSKLSGSVAGGLLGGETDIYGARFQSSQYFPLWFDHVINFRGSVAMVHEYGDSDRVPLFDRLFLGGARSVRGFRYRDVGPRDLGTDEPLGGRSDVYGTAEYAFPIVERIRGAVFYDAGIVWQKVFEEDDDNPARGDGKLHSSWGMGVRLDLPGFPIQLDYSFPLASDGNGRPEGRFSFWMGYAY